MYMTALQFELFISFVLTPALGSVIAFNIFIFLSYLGLNYPPATKFKSIFPVYIILLTFRFICLIPYLLK